MSQQVATQTWKPPTLAELTSDIELAAKNDVLNIALNKEPPESWIKTHPMLTVKVGERDGNPIMEPLKYIPIDKQRFLARRIFGYVKEEILRECVMFQSVCVTVRVHYRNPITGEDMFMDGIGAVDVQTRKGASAADLSAINAGAVQKAAPAAAAYAAKNAYDKLGRIFGGEIQKGALQFDQNLAIYADAVYNVPTLENLQELYSAKKENMTAEEKANAERILNNNETTSFKKLQKQLQSK